MLVQWSEQPVQAVVVDGLLFSSFDLSEHFLLLISLVSHLIFHQSLVSSLTLSLSSWKSHLHLNPLDSTKMGFPWPSFSQELWQHKQSNWIYRWICCCHSIHKRCGQQNSETTSHLLLSPNMEVERAWQTSLLTHYQHLWACGDTTCWAHQVADYQIQTGHQHSLQ